MRDNVSDSFKSKSSGFSLALNVPGIIMSQQMTAPGSEISDPSARFYEGLELDSLGFELVTARRMEEFKPLSYCDVPPMRPTRGFTSALDGSTCSG